jgi:hypothetical protein
MGAVHGLDVLLWVPVVFDKDDGIGACEIETETADAGGEEEDVVGGIRVEFVDDFLALRGFDCAVLIF